MKVIIIGASGTLGKAVDRELSARHEVVRIGHSSGDLRVDITDLQSIEQLYEKIGEFDAVISATGNLHFGPFQQFTPEQFEIGLRSKLMGQVNLVTLGLKHIRPRGSFTLTSGQLNDDPICGGVSGAMVNGALEGFVRSAAIELPHRLRINLVSPTVTEESLPAYGAFFPGQKPVPAAAAALGYAKSVEGSQTGRVYRIGWSRDQ
jgi:NAD(P)-dependent dehydrogenase (short-subunit alcohol dehydrogenase family)